MNTHLHVTASAANLPDAIARVAKRTEGTIATTTGRGYEYSPKHLLWKVEIAIPSEATAGDRNDLWVQLTSYGLSPDTTLGATWEATLG